MPLSIARLLLLTTAATAIFLNPSLLTAQRLIVSDPRGQVRLPEVIELPLSEVRHYFSDIESREAENALTHERLATQVYNSPDGPAHDLLLIAAHVNTSHKLELNFVPKDNVHPIAPLVFGREATERKDDFAWENQLVTYRVYGPALEATGEITSGIDVWSKRVPNFVIDRFYKRDAEGARTHNPALSYHKDDGVGLDSYLVGSTRGCGGTGVFSNGKLWISKNYTHLRIISSGPVRFEFEMTYAPWDVDGVEVTETKRITLDAGTHLNKIQSTFTFKGPEIIHPAAGLAVRKGADVHTLTKGRILSVWDTPQDPSAGRIGTAIIESLDQDATVGEVESQTLLVFPVRSGKPFTYYAGSSWSKADMPTQQAWDNYLQSTLTQLEHPLKIEWQGKQQP